MRVLRLWAVLAVSSALASANVGYFSGAGHSVLLQKSADIQLVSEDVRIALDSRRAEYICRFELKNLAAASVSVQVGFPLTSDGESYRKREQVVDGEVVARPPVDEARVVAEEYRFIARDADRTYHVRYVEQDSARRYKHLLLWNMDFAPGETRILIVSYSMGLSGSLFSADRRVWEHWFTDQRIPESLMYSEKWFEETARRSVLYYCEYVTETGASWAGRIERATFSVDTTMIERDIRAFGCDALTSRGGDGAWGDGTESVHPGQSLTWRGLRPDGWEASRSHAGLPRALVSPLAGSGSPGFVEWKFAPFLAGKRFIVSCVDTLLPANAEAVGGWSPSLAEEGPAGLPSQTDLAAMRETLAATCGIVPTTPRVREVVELLVWYSPVQGRTEADLDEPQRALLAAYDAAVARELDRRAAMEPTADK